jgi:hypothetical protein
MEQIKLIKENVMDWLEAGIVERANLPYNSPIFCVEETRTQAQMCLGLQVLESQDPGFQLQHLLYRSVSQRSWRGGLQNI